MTWFKREKKPIEVPDERRVVTEGLWIKCNGCKEPLWKKDLEGNLHVCPKCNHHYKISAYDRINLLMDPGWTEQDALLYSTDPLNFKASKPYKESLKSLPEILCSGIRIIQNIANEPAKCSLACGVTAHAILCAGRRGLR